MSEEKFEGHLLHTQQQCLQDVIFFRDQKKADSGGLFCSE